MENPKMREMQFERGVNLDKLLSNDNCNKQHKNNKTST